MNTKKLIVFLLFAFLPMLAVGVMMHLSGLSSVMETRYSVISQIP